MKLKSIGKVLDAHGIKGELKVKLFSHETEWHSSFLEAHIDTFQYQVLALRANKSVWILKLKGLADRSSAELLKGKELMACQTLFQTSDSEEPFMSELLGFKIDLNGEKVGVVFSFKETLAHFSLVIKNESGFFEVPYVDEFLKSTDRKAKVLFMSFPTDLLSDDFKLKDSK